LYLLKKTYFLTIDTCDENVRLHNFNLGESSPKPLENLKDIKPEKIIVSVIKEVDIPNQKKKEVSDVPKVMAHCLPVIYETEDSLYGEVKMKYGQKFIAELVVISSSDLSCQVWSKEHSFEMGTIIYIAEEMRWWKVAAIVDKFGGKMFNCVPSEFTPSFQGQ
jgi:hypothetical protein